MNIFSYAYWLVLNYNYQNNDTVIKNKYWDKKEIELWAQR